MTFREYFDHQMFWMLYSLQSTMLLLGLLFFLLYHLMYYLTIKQKMHNKICWKWWLDRFCDVGVDHACYFLKKKKWIHWFTKWIGHADQISKIELCKIESKKVLWSCDLVRSELVKRRWGDQKVWMEGLTQSGEMEYPDLIANCEPLKLTITIPRTWRHKKSQTCWPFKLNDHYLNSICCILIIDWFHDHFDEKQQAKSPKAILLSFCIF